MMIAFANRGFRTLYILAVTVYLLPGCGGTDGLPNRVQVRGRVTDAGTPLEVAGRELGLGMVTVGFYPVVEDGTLVEATSAQADAEGYFEVIDGLPPGKYLITVRQWDPYPQTDRLRGRFDERNSPIVREFGGEEEELTIDVSDQKP